MNALPPDAFFDSLLKWQLATQHQTLDLWRQLQSGAAPPAPPTGHGQGVTNSEVVYQHPGYRLLRYQHAETPQYAEPVLMCFSLVNRPYILDMAPSRSVVEQLLNRGFDVYLIDWTPPTDADQSKNLADYVLDTLGDAARAVASSAATQQVHLLGYCMGGTLAAMLAALRPAMVRNLLLLATPIDFHAGDGLLSLWARPEYFDVDRFVEAFGNCPGWFLHSCFQFMKPVQNYFEKYLNLVNNPADGTFDNFLALERWASDSVPVAGQTFREFVKWMYQENRLVRGEVVLNGEPVDLAAIECPVLSITADRDHLVPPASSQAIESLARSQSFSSLTVDSGHIGLAIGTKAHDTLWPQATDWLAQHSTQVA